MSQRLKGLKDGAEATVRDIRRRTRRQYSAEEKIRTEEGDRSWDQRNTTSSAPGASGRQGDHDRAVGSCCIAAASDRGQVQTPSIQPSSARRGRKAMPIETP